MRVYLNTSREGYSPEQLTDTITVGELVEHLTNNYDESDQVFFRNDNGYTYGTLWEYEITDEENEESEY